MDVHAPLDPVATALERNGALLAPRLLGELPDDGGGPSAADLRRAGTLGASLVAMRAPSEGARAGSTGGRSG